MNPEAENYYDWQITVRLTADGLPVHPGNDYERHLFARRLRQLGHGREEVKIAIIRLGLDDIQINKRDKYVEDVLNSIIVGFSDNPLPVYAGNS